MIKWHEEQFPWYVQVGIDIDAVSLLCLCTRYTGTPSSWVVSTKGKRLKGIFSDSNNIFSWQESEDTNKQTKLFPKFHLIPILHF